MRLNCTLASSSTSWFDRPLVMRNMNAVLPRYGATTARSLNSTAAVGREKREKRIPVPSAKISSPTSDSAVMTKCAGMPFGVTLP